MPRAGYSFLELAIVVLVLGILAGVAAPKYGEALDHYRVEAAARRIVADLKFGRERAISTAAEQRITFEAAADSYTLDGMDDINHATHEYSVNLAAQGYPVDLTASFGGGSLFLWRHRGDAAQGGSVTVTSGAASRTVTVSPPCSITTSSP